MSKNLQLIEKIIDRMFEGNSLKKLLEDYCLDPKTFFVEMYAAPHLNQMYEKAQSARTELLVEEIIDISDTQADPQRARVMVEARKWYAAKMKPQKYGERIDFNHTHTIDISGALTEARARVQLPPSYPSRTINMQPYGLAKQSAQQLSGCEPEDDTPTRDADKKDVSDILE